jgi:drug/metabolite transporter (DMT)-like permease
MSMSATVSSLKSKRVAAPGRSDQPLRGILLLMGSTVFLACSDAMAKYLARTLPPVEVAWLRFAMFALILAPFILMNPGVLRSVRPGLQTLRALAMLASSLFFITGLQFLPIAAASATAFVAPIFVTALSVLLLSEKVGKRRWAATIAGLCGVFLIVRPGTAAFNAASILPILSALAWACTLVATRLIAGADRVVTTMAYGALVGFLVLSAVVPFYWVAPSWTEVAIGAAIGVAATAGHWIVVMAFRYADASVLAPFSYSQLLWVTLLGLVAFGEVPDIYTAAGAAIIVASGLYTAHRERARRVAMVDAEPAPGA